MRRFIPSPEAIQLIHDGQIALSDIEASGIRIDKDYLDSALDSTAVQIKKLKDALLADPDYKKHWRRRFGDKSNVASPAQIAAVVFQDLGHKSKIKTTSGARDSASEKALEGIDIPLVKNYLEMQHLIKGRDTFLEGIRRETVRHDDGDYYVHPVFNLNTAVTFRSSADSPNIMFMPTRNPALADMVRKCFMPRRGHQIVEIDFGQMEARIPCCYSLDPVLMKYVSDPKTDMHRDFAAQLFMLPVDVIPKAKVLRQLAKVYVFGTLYGDYYVQTSPGLWNGSAEVKLPDGRTVREHLASCGIVELGACDHDEPPEDGTWEAHVRDVDKDYWRRFAVHAQWKRDWFNDYRRNGGCRFLSGFVMVGPHSKNDITSYPIQGTAFHCLLWALPRIVNRLRRYKMRSRVIGEIHDSIQLDVWPPERDVVIDMCVSVMTEEVKSWAKWLNVPLVVEPECCPIDKSWLDKQGLVRVNGKWIPANIEGWTKKYGDWRLQCP